MTLSMLLQYTCGLGRKEWRMYPYLYYRKRLYSCTRRCIEKLQNLLAVQDGNGDFVKDMESVICHFKEKSSLQMSARDFVQKFKLTVMRPVLIFSYYHIKH